MNTAPTSEQSNETAGDIGAGHVLGRYELLLPIASGGMAMVWAARLTGSRGFQKIVAVKTILPKLCEDEQFERMFLDEASLASQIQHPHVVEILDLGEHDGVLYLVMEWIEGVALNQMMKAAKKRGGVPRSVAVRIIMQACAGLHAAHELKDRDGNLVGLVHRDVSPQNILVSYDGVAKVVDFGIAKATALGDGSTVAGQIKGKVAYMAPEQVKGGDIDRRVDVFAAGVVLYALTTGKHPLRRESEAATMYNICAPEPVLAPSKIVPGYPPALERVIMRALAKDSGKRFATANEFLRALDALPASVRASTDEDVGSFVRSLFEERRKERAAALTEALQLADRQRQSRMIVPSMTGSAQGQTPASSVSVVTGVGDGQGITGESLTGPSGGTLSAASLVANAFRPRRRLYLSAAAAGVLVLGGVALVAATSGDPEAVEAPSESVTAAAQNDQGSPDAAAESADTDASTKTGPGADDEAVDLASLKLETDEDEDEEAEENKPKPKRRAWWPRKGSGAAPANKPGAKRTQPAGAGTKPAPGATGEASPAPTKKGWDKHSAGF